MPPQSKLKKIQGRFKDLHRNLMTFQGLSLKFKDFSRLGKPIHNIICLHSISQAMTYRVTPSTQRQMQECESGPKI